MKTILLVRHAKSSWDNPEWSDFERPLNKRGLKDAPVMGKVIAELGVKPDLVLSSPAARAFSTAEIIAKEINYPESDIKKDVEIYERGTKHVLSLVAHLNEKIGTVMVFGHNPDMTSLATYYSGEFFDNVPTCGIVCIDFDIETWGETKSSNGKLRFFEFPKKYVK